MKKQKILVVVMGLALIFLFAGIAYSAEPAGQVLAVKNNVFRIRGESRDNARPKMDLLMKDAVETDKQSRAKLFFMDDSILNIGELSRVQVEEYMYNPEKQRSRSIYSLIDGSIKVVVGRSDLEVHTASAVAAARGTKFIMWNMVTAKEREKGDKAKKQTCVLTLEGKVEFKLKKEAITNKTKRDSVVVNEGEISCLEADNISDADSADLKTLSAWRDSFPVFASTLPQREEVPAFAPEPPAPLGITGESPVSQEPEPFVPTTTKQGDFQRIK
jgi:ferric-dicitrate binding protein FerR (iron transport regulator)